MKHALLMLTILFTISCSSNLKTNTGLKSLTEPKIKISHSCFVYYGKAFQDLLYRAGSYWSARGKPNIEITQKLNGAPIICYKGNLPNNPRALHLGRASNYIIEILYDGLAVDDSEYCQPKYNWRLSRVLIHELGHFHGETHELSKHEIMNEKAAETCDVPW